MKSGCGNSPSNSVFFFVFVLNIGCRCATIRTVMSYTTLTKSKRQEIGVYPNTQGTSLIGLHKLQISPQAELLLIIIFKTLLAFEFLISICSTLTRPFLTTPCRSAKTCRQGRLAFQLTFEYLRLQWKQKNPIHRGHACYCLK